MANECLVCSGTGFSPCFKGLKKCVSCNFVTTAGEFSEAELRKLYGEDYFFGSEYVDYLKDRRVLQGNFKGRLKKILEFKRGGSLVEIGCAYGFFLDLAKDYFKVKGYEISAVAADYARGMGLDVETSDFSRAEMEPGSADVVVMWDVIEHLMHPDRHIKKAAWVLKEGGLLCMTTGDIESLNARFRKDRWRLIHPPTHLHYFSRRTLGLLMERNGFETIHSGYIGVSRSMRQIAYSILVLGGKKYARQFSLLEKTGMLDFVFTLNLRDIMFVIARKSR